MGEFLNCVTKLNYFSDIFMLLTLYQYPEQFTLIPAQVVKKFWARKAAELFKHIF